MTCGRSHQRFGAAWRWAAPVVLCALGGLALTVMVSALCLFYSPMGTKIEDHGGVSSDDLAPVGSVRFKHGQLYGGFGFREWMDYWIWVPPRGVRPSVPNTVYTSVAGAGIHSIRCGWPFLAFATPPDRFPGMCDAVGWDAAVQQAYSHSAAASAVPAFLHIRPYREWPTRPLVGGIVADSALFGMLIGLVAFAPRVVRRAWRRRTGRCLECGYPVTGLGRCPECGTSAWAELVRRVRGRARAVLGAIVPQLWERGVVR